MKVLGKYASFLPKIACYAVVGYFSYLMLLITMQYIPLRLDVAFLNIKQEALSHRYYPIAFFAHVFTSIFALLLGTFQFSDTIRKVYPRVHRTFGKLYVLIVLCIASPSGLVIAMHANGGFHSKVSFVLQAVLWFYFTYSAFHFALQKEWGSHRNFMMRSYALTLSAISLRFFKWLIVAVFQLPPMDTYQIVAWLGWLVNLLIAEVLIWRLVRTDN